MCVDAATEKKTRKERKWRTASRENTCPSSFVGFVHFMTVKWMTVGTRVLKKKKNKGENVSGKAPKVDMNFAIFSVTFLLDRIWSFDMHKIYFPKPFNFLEPQIRANNFGSSRNDGQTSHSSQRKCNHVFSVWDICEAEKKIRWLHCIVKWCVNVRNVIFFMQINARAKLP